MKYEHQVRMQQRHLDAIVKALKFRQQLLSGGLYETLGKVAIEAWESFPEVERSPYPARRGSLCEVRQGVKEICGSIAEIVWAGHPSGLDFDLSQEGRLAFELIPQSGRQVRRTRFTVKLRKGNLARIRQAVELELRTRIAHLDPMLAFLLVEQEKHVRGEESLWKRSEALRTKCDHLKRLAWQIGRGNYGPWFSHKTKFLYDIYAAIESAFGNIRYSHPSPLVKNVPMMQIERC